MLERFKPRNTTSVEHLAELARTAGNDLRSALSLSLSALAPEQQVAVLSAVIDTLPPGMRAAIWGDAGMGMDGWEALKATLTREERRPKVVEALVERGRQTHELDLDGIPEGVRVKMGIYRMPIIAPLPPPDYLESMHSDPSLILRLRALGNCAFETDGVLYIHRNPVDTERIAAGRIVTLGGEDVYGEYTSNLRYGKPLVAKLGETAVPFTNYNSREKHADHGGLELCFVGTIELDGSPVFSSVPYSDQHL